MYSPWGTVGGDQTEGQTQGVTYSLKLGYQTFVVIPPSVNSLPSTWNSISLRWDCSQIQAQYPHDTGEGRSRPQKTGLLA